MPIRIDILRHGKALPAASGGDRARSLSPDGVRALTALAGRLAAANWRPDRVFSSPYDRARQSAEILAAAASSGTRVEVLAALEPDHEPADVIEALSELGVTEGHVLVVGHQPLLGLLVGLLTGADASLSPGAMVQIHCPEGARPKGGRVIAVLTPEA